MAADSMINLIVGAIETVSITFQHKLDTDELLTDSPTAVSSDTDGVTATSVAINEGNLKILSDNCVAGQVVQFKITAVSAGTYSVRVEAPSDAGNNFVMDISVTVTA